VDVSEIGDLGDLRSTFWPFSPLIPLSTPFHGWKRSLEEYFQGKFMLNADLKSSSRNSDLSKHHAGGMPFICDNMAKSTMKNRKNSRKELTGRGSSVIVKIVLLTFPDKVTSRIRRF